MNNDERINNLENQINILSNKYKENNERYLNLEREIHNLKEYNKKLIPIFLIN
jgi:chaperonin cofactor prefoldin